MKQVVIKDDLIILPHIGSIYSKVTGNELGWDKDGYLMVDHNGKNVRAHRLIYEAYHGNVPTYIDHINGNKRDNRVDNLRPASSAENNRNVGLTKANTSGYKGVSKTKTGKYRAAIQYNGTDIYLGVHDSAEAAALVYDTAAILYHGEFAWLNFG